jgi:2-polyprenyl-3-methyl-5-hydroxy-6-metoxy-1,4-benzoquinol methylase
VNEGIKSKVTGRFLIVGSADGPGLGLALGVWLHAGKASKNKEVSVVTTSGNFVRLLRWLGMAGNMLFMATQGESEVGSVVQQRLALAPPLEDHWRDVLDSVARHWHFPTSGQVQTLGSRVAALSQRYNRLPTQSAIDDYALLAARLGFSFPRDVPKAGSAFAELILAGLIKLEPNRPLRVLDVGAGLGAGTWGLARALAFHGQEGQIRAYWTDSDESALKVGKSIVDHVPGEQKVQIYVETHVSNVLHAHPGLRHRADVVILSQVLSEMDPDAPEESRLDSQQALLKHYLTSVVEESGSLVIIEPALRDRTRHLHKLRNRMINQGFHVFAPCLHQHPCPMLEVETDWCHEDLPINLPNWLVPVAREAGLRFEGLTFSYLVVRKQTANVENWLVPESGCVRMVSGPKKSKGKTERMLCGTFPDRPAVVRLARLQRDGKHDKRGAWECAERGELVQITPFPETTVRRLPAETKIVYAPWDQTR